MAKAEQGGLATRLLYDSDVVTPVSSVAMVTSNES